MATWLLAAALVVLIGWEVAGPGPEGSAVATRPATLGRAAPAPAASGAGDLAYQRAAQSLARPLFTPERRPAPDGTAPALAGAALPRLAAVFTGPSGRRAMFASDTKPIFLVEGGVIGGFTVRSIAPGEVTLSGPKGLMVLRTSFGVRPDGTQPSVTGPPFPGPSLAPLNRPIGPMPFQQSPAPSGLDILRNLGASPTPVPVPAPSR